MRAFKYIDGRAVPVAYVGQVVVELIPEPMPDCIDPTKIDRPIAVTRRTWHAHTFQDWRSTEHVVLYLPDGEVPDERHAAALSSAL